MLSIAKSIDLTRPGLTLIRSILPFGIFLSTQVAVAQAPTCQQIFSRSEVLERSAAPLAASKPTIFEKNRTSIEEFYAQKIENRDVDHIILTVTPTIERTIKYMADHLPELLDKVPDRFPEPHYKEPIRKGLHELITRVEAALNGKKISYAEYIDLSYGFSAAAALALKDRNSDYYLKNPAEFDRTLPYYIKDLTSRERGSIYAPSTKNMLMPVVGNFSVKTLNEMQARGLALVSMTMKKESADGVTFDPTTFFQHDLLHNLSSAITTNSLDSPDYVERVAFYEKFEAFVDQPEVSPRQKEIRRLIWFISFHEANQPMRPESLGSAFSQDRPSPATYLPGTSFDFYFRRLTNPTDFGSSFVDRPLTKGELTAELTAIAKFVRGYVKASQAKPSF